jgi:hypothetical protein
MRKRLVACCLWTALPCTAGAQSVSVADQLLIPVGAGETQSTVVRPGTNAACPAGAFLATNDRDRPPGSVVFHRPLDQPSSAAAGSVFDLAGLAAWSGSFSQSKYHFGTNDHDLIALGNGDVLYLTGAFSREAVADPEPRWMPLTTRWLDFNDGQGVVEFGPRARTVLLVFRSTDCGSHFQYVSQVDPATQEDGSCALPQYRLDEARAPIHAEPYDMGGSDGQLVKLDPADDRLYLTFPCVGYQEQDSSGPGFVLSDVGLNRTLIMMSPDRGSTWQSQGMLRGREAWRFGVVPMGGGKLALGFGSSVIFAEPIGAGHIATSTVDADPAWGYPAYADVGGARSRVAANVLTVPIIVRGPDAGSLVLAFPDRFGDKGFGYRVFVFHPGTGQVAEAAPILPAQANPQSFIFHLTAVDPGSGPVLLYWYDFHSVGLTTTGSIRGRVLAAGGASTEDFAISRTLGAPRTFQVLPVRYGYWFGDYHTAGGFVAEGPGSAAHGRLRIASETAERRSFFPVWVEPDGAIHYTRVDYPGAPGPGAIPLAMTGLPQSSWRAAVPTSLGPAPAAASVPEPDVREQPERASRVRMVRPLLRPSP